MTGVREGDAFFCLNFRADRAREILAAIGAPEFDGFDRGAKPQLSSLLGMVEYSDEHAHYMTTVFPSAIMHNTLGEWVAHHGKTQFRLAETEKYPHVTFFLNGGKETPEEGEDRCMPKSPRSRPMTCSPRCRAEEVTEHFVEAIRHGYDLIVMNFANPDMVGHTGDLKAAIQACEAVDRGLGKVLEALEGRGRRDDRHRRSRQLRNDGRPRNRRTAYVAHARTLCRSSFSAARKAEAARRAACRSGTDPAAAHGARAARRDDGKEPDR